MSRSWLPRRWESTSGTTRENWPFLTLNREINRLFDNMFTGAGWDVSASPAAKFSFTPSVEVAEDKEGFTVRAELAGLEQKDLDITFENNTLYLRGERKEEKKEENKEKNTYFSEIRYGSFERVIPFGDTEIDEDKIDAQMKNGVLNIRLPRSADTVKKSRKVSIR